jgi:hypothetical protein
MVLKQGDFWRTKKREEGETWRFFGEKNRTFGDICGRKP